MDRKFLMAAIVAVALAGCADAPPSGEFTTTQHNLVADGTVTIDYQREVKPIDEEAGFDSPVDCAPDEAPGQADQFKCVDPYTTLDVHFMNLKNTAQGTYSVYFVDSTGNNSEMAITDLAYDNGTMFNGQASFDMDYESTFDTVELRIGDFVLANSPAMEGENNFALFANATMVQASATYEGKDVTVDVSGLQAGISYTAWLFGEDENGVQGHLESFSVSEGINEYSAENNINTYSQFHIHVANTDLNAAVAIIE